MKALLVLLTLLTAGQLQGQNFIAADVRTTDGRAGIAQAIARVAPSGEAWVAWTVPGGNGHTVCCWSGSTCCSSCSLDGESSFSTSGRKRTTRAHLEADDTIVVVARVSGGVAKKLRVFGSDCEVDAGGATIHLLQNVSDVESLDWLEAQVAKRSDRDHLLAIVAMHSHASVVPRLIALARNDASSNVRRSALFWLGQRAGEKAAAELRHAVDNDPEDDVREHAVFAISQLPAERSVPILIDLINTHESARVRKKAMFWLAQTDDPRALDAIEAILQ